METVFNYSDYSEMTANTGAVNISTANPNLDGTGTLGTVLTGAANGTMINSIIIKATQATTQGMIRFFINNSTNTQLLQEVEIPACTPSAVQPSFETRISLDINLAPGNVLKVSTERGESFNIIAEGLDWAYPATPACCDHMQRIANNGFNKVSVANSNLNGTGTLVSIMTGANKGTTLTAVHIKGQASTTQGMIRLFLNTGTTANFLFTEIQLPATTQTAIVPTTLNYTFNFSLIFANTHQILASTQNAETFSIVMDGLNWKY
mgnify:CR=1 FL=1